MNLWPKTGEGIIFVNAKMRQLHVHAMRDRNNTFYSPWLKLTSFVIFRTKRLITEYKLSN